MPTDIKGWHQGERAIQYKLGFGDEVRMRYTSVRPYMPEQHRVFHTSNLPFIPMTILDKSGRPWGSVFAGKGGEIGFVKSSDEVSMSMDLVSWKGDPLLRNLRDRRKGKKGRALVAGIGIELPTRRRNKFAGWIQSSSIASNTTDVHLKMHINQTLGFVKIHQFKSGWN